MNKLIVVVIAGLCFVQVQSLFARIDIEQEIFEQVCKAMIIRDLAFYDEDDENIMDDEMVEAIELRYRSSEDQELFRGKKITIPKILFALKVGQELVNTAIKVIEMYKNEAKNDTHQAGQEKK